MNLLNKMMMKEKEPMMKVNCPVKEKKLMMKIWIKSTGMMLRKLKIKDKKMNKIKNKKLKMETKMKKWMEKINK